MKKIILLLTVCVVLCSHDMYLKLDTYFLTPNTESRILLYNGTFDRSDNVIDRYRMTDVSLVGNGSRMRLDSNQWSEEGNATILNFRAGEAGTWVVGVSTRPRNIEMEAEAFNDYLEHDGVLDMLKWRKENNALNDPAVEKYSKHVKTIFQVGDKLTTDWNKVLGYPIEFIPTENPYDLHPGHAIGFELLFDGEPLADQLVYVGSQHGDHEHDHGHGHSHDDEDHDHSHDMTQYRTDANGRLAVNITHEGIWYLRTIHLMESEEEGLTHESNWATLTFEVGEGHSHEHVQAADDHAHEHDDEGGIPASVFIIGSLVLVALLFFVFNRRAK